MSKNFPVVKTVFYMSRGSFQWSFFWKNVYFSKFSFFEQFFFSFWSKDFQQDCQNRNVRFHKKTWKEKNLLKNLCVCYSFFRNEPKTFGPLAKVFRQRCENCFWCVHNINMRIFLTKKILFSNLAHCAILFRHSFQDFWAGLLENTILFLNHFRILSEQFPLSWQKN